MKLLAINHCVLFSFVYRRLHDVIADVTALQLVVSDHSVDPGPRSLGAVPRHRHFEVRLDIVQLLLVTQGTCRTHDRRRLEDLTWRLDKDCHRTG